MTSQPPETPAASEPSDAPEVSDAAVGGNGSGPRPDVLRAEHIGKRFGAVTALVDVNLRLAKGEVLGLLGDNGAGKSTLLKILCGFQQQDSGALTVNGEEVLLRSVDHARSLGIDAVYQDLALINQLSVYHNMFLNREQLRWPLLNNRAMRKTAREHLDAMGVNIPSVDVEVARLSGGQRQAGAIARAGYADAKILQLDLIKDLKRRGDVSIIIIAHNYGQALEVCDRINLLQHGMITLDKASKDTSVAELNDIVVAEYRRAMEARQRR
jgi:simple sugar transport system ATP-binding protein